MAARIVFYVKMAPKEQKSKKAIREKSAMAVSDATFGLKNKNKSKKVQKFVSQVEHSVKNSDGTLDRQRNNELKKKAKIAKQLEEAEMLALLGEGLMGQQGVQKGVSSARAEALGLLGDVPEEIQAMLDEMSSDSDSEDEVKEKRTTIYLSSDDEGDGEGDRVFREKTIEDIIEAQRAQLIREGKPGTPITNETFNAWRSAKLEKRKREAEERVKAEQTKKKGGKGLSVLSGKELFAYDISLFKDDDAAINRAQEAELSGQKALDAEAEALLEAAEAEKAQKEQERLMEVQKVEREARRLKDEDRRRVAALKDMLFDLGGVTVNEVVFDEDEREDLTPFADKEDEDSEDEGERK